MKKLGITTIVALLVFVLLTTGLNITSVFAQTQTQLPENSEFIRTVTVSGTGSIAVRPDAAVVVVGVRTEAEDASAALDQNNQQMDDLMDALRQAGIAQEDIQTQYINLSPRYSQVTEPSGSLQVNGYIASNTVQVRVGDVEDVGQLIDNVVQAGSNLVESIRFEVSDPSQNLQQAREQAFNDARRKAEQLASLAGVQLGRVISLSENSTQFLQPFGRGGAGAFAQEAVLIEPGTQNVDVTLQVTWEITGDQTTAAEGTSIPIIPQTGSALTSTPPATSPTSRVTQAVPTQTPITIDETDSSAAGQLRAQGVSVRSLGNISQPFFPVTGQVLDVNGDRIQVFEFEREADAEQAINSIKQAGDSFGLLDLEFNTLPKIYHEGETVLIYAGDDARTFDLLMQIFGEPLSYTR